MRKVTNDFDWEKYTDEFYLREIDDAWGRGESFVLSSETRVVDGLVLWNDNVHPHIKALCDSVLESGAASVFECGCAGGHNLACIRHILPKIAVGGCDRSKSQIVAAGVKINVPFFVRERLLVCNLVTASPDEVEALGKFEYVFTNAVLMHIPYDDALAFLRNMAKISTKIIRINEAVGSHDYRELFAESGIAANHSIENNETTWMCTRRGE